MTKKPTIITNPPKAWWAGDERVEQFMPPVDKAIKRHIKWPSKEFTDIYNRAYEAVYQAIKELEAENERLKEQKDSVLDNLNDWQNGYSKLLKETNRVTKEYKDIIARLNAEEPTDTNISP